MKTGYNITVEDSQLRLQNIRKWKNYTKWDFSHPALAPKKDGLLKATMPNILYIVADDLGYGDTSLSPFTTSKMTGIPDWPCYPGGYLTPSLQRMASKGIRLTNFHAASSTCSPSRVAILTGLFPWRVGALNAFELGPDPVQRNAFLPQVKTLPSILREAGYYTAHAGKW